MEGTDTGIWTEMEATWVDGTWQSKLALLIIFPIFFFFRPFFMCITKPLEALDAGSWLVVPAFDIALFYFSGMSVKPMAYLLLGLYFGVGLHPIAGHVISEHCMMMNDGQVRDLLCACSCLCACACLLCVSVCVCVCAQAPGLTG